MPKMSDALKHFASLLHPNDLESNCLPFYQNDVVRRISRPAGDPYEHPVYKFWRKTQQGICWELCRRWATEMLALPAATTDDERAVKAAGFRRIIESLSPFDVEKMAKIHVDHDKWDTSSNLDISGTLRQKKHDLSRRRLFGFTTMRDREAAVKHAYMNPGVYIYIFGQPKGFGHAFGFDTRGGGMIFYDPNIGLFWTSLQNKFQEWYHWFWEAQFDEWRGSSYKKCASKGYRKLTYYK